ncbi:MAG: NADH peroxidase [Lachnospiraceae bacterium]|nr:NADH peroxidase [Lachnospiraceae bacterium]
MAKYVCPVCGYVHEGDTPPEFCPVCKVPGEKFILQSEEMSWAAEHVIGVGRQFPAEVPAEVQEEIIMGLKSNFEGECSEVGMYLAMARAAHREGYPEIGLYWEKAAWEEAEHAAKFCELLGDMVSPSTKKNLSVRVEAENGATEGKTNLAKLCKQYNLDALHDTIHEMARDEARHGKAFKGLLDRYFG